MTKLFGVCPFRAYTHAPLPSVVAGFFSKWLTEYGAGGPGAEEESFELVVIKKNPIK